MSHSSFSPIFLSERTKKKGNFLDWKKSDQNVLKWQSDQKCYSYALFVSCKCTYFIKQGIFHIRLQVFAYLSAVMLCTGPTSPHTPGAYLSAVMLCAGPTSPHTPGALPGFLITDWDQSDCKVLCHVTLDPTKKSNWTKLLLKRLRGSRTIFRFREIDTCQANVPCTREICRFSL